MLVWKENQLVLWVCVSWKMQKNFEFDFLLTNCKPPSCSHDPPLQTKMFYGCVKKLWRDCMKAIYSTLFNPCKLSNEFLITTSSTYSLFVIYIKICNPMVSTCTPSIITRGILIEYSCKFGLNWNFLTWKCLWGCIVVLVHFIVPTLWF